MYSQKMRMIEDILVSCHLIQVADSIEQNSPWETTSFPTSQEIPPDYGPKSFSADFTTAHRLPI